MFWSRLLYIVPILSATAIGTGLAIYSWKKRPAPGAAPMSALATAIAFWSLFYALELTSTTLTLKPFFAKIQYLGIVTVPVAWLCLALEYTGLGHWVTRRNVTLLSLLPASTIIILWVEPILLWPENRVARGGPLDFFAPTHGPWFWVNSGYVYLLLILGSVTLVVASFRSHALYRWQARAFLLSIVLPLVPNAFYISGLLVLDLTPFGFALACLVVAWGIFRAQLFEVVPVARVALVESMSDPVLVLDARNRIIDANPASQALTGRFPSSLVGKPVAEVGGSVSTLLDEVAQLEEAQRELEVCTGELRHCYLVRLSVVRDRKARLRGKLLLFHDITERRRAQQALQTEKTYTEAIINALPGVFFLLDEWGRLVRWNRNLEDVTGYGHEELAAIDPFLLVSENERQMAREKVLAGFSDGEMDAELPYVSRTGRQTPYLFTARRVTLKGRPHLVGTGLDITERRERERELECFVAVSRALQASERREEMLPVILEGAMRLLRAEGAMLLSRRPAACSQVELALGRWQALSGQEVCGEPGAIMFRDLTAGPFFLAPDVRELDDWPPPEWLVALEAIAGVPLARAGSCSTVVLLGRDAPFSDTEGRSLAAIVEIAASALSRAAVLETVEQRVRERTQALNAANERLRSLDRVKSKLIHDVSHELRTPVSTISLYLSLLESGNPEKRRQYMAVLREQSRRLGRVVESVLDVTRVEAMAAGELLQAIALNPLVADVVRTHTRDAAQSGREIRCCLEDSLPGIAGIRPLLVSALSQLVENALKYTTAGTIRVATAFHEIKGMVRVSVEDTGPGISQDELPYVFDRFYRGEQVSQLTIPGSGLGLSLVRQIATLHRGQIAIESKIEEGTTVCLWFPIAGEGISTSASLPLSGQKSG